MNPQLPLVNFGRQFYNRGWMEGTGGNLSVRSGNNPLELIITPSSVNKGYLSTDDLIAVREGRPLNHPKGYAPSYETPSSHLVELARGQANDALQ